MAALVTVEAVERLRAAMLEADDQGDLAVVYAAAAHLLDDIYGKGYWRANAKLGGVRGYAPGS